MDDEETEMEELRQLLLQAEMAARQSETRSESAFKIDQLVICTWNPKT